MTLREHPRLSPRRAPDHPHDLFWAWFDEAEKAGVPLPNAMVLATATRNGIPSARAVLMKDHGPDGITFYSNALSRKGADLAMNPVAALTFVWTQVDRQVRIEGTVEQLSAEAADAYFATRPLRARAGAVASPQSRVIDSHRLLLNEVEQLERLHPEGVPRPPHWVGYLVRPTRWEFWQAGPDRLHDRIEYRRDDADRAWTRVRLAP